MTSRKRNNSHNGFTLIETMISVSLFIVVAITSMGTFLNANALYQKSHDVRSIMDSVSFIMEDMSRNLRMGYKYHCVINGSYPSDPSPAGCSLGGGIIFKNQNNSTWMYRLEGPSGKLNIEKSTDAGSTWVQLNPPEVTFENLSGFKVVGAVAPTENSGVWSGDTVQPFITIMLSGNINYKNIKTPFALQTSVSMRRLDVP